MATNITYYQGALTNEECSLLRKSFEYYVKEGQVTSLTKKFMDIDLGLENLREMSDLGSVIKFYDEEGFLGILVYSITYDWWTKEKALNEHFVLSVLGKKGLQRKVCQVLDELAEQNNVAYICTGCFLLQQSKVVMNGYYKNGYKSLFPTAVKELK